MNVSCLSTGYREANFISKGCKNQDVICQGFGNHWLWGKACTESKCNSAVSYDHNNASLFVWYTVSKNNVGEAIADTFFLSCSSWWKLFSFRTRSHTKSMTLMWSYNGPSAIKHLFPAMNLNSVLEATCFLWSPGKAQIKWGDNGAYFWHFNW